MRTDLFIAGRLKLRQKGSRRSAMSIRISVAGVVLSVVIMLLTIAIVSGFKARITEKIVGFDSQITISAMNNAFESETPVTVSDVLIDGISSILPEAHIDSSIVMPAMLKTNDNFHAVVFRAYDSGKDRTFLKESLVAGTMPDFSDERSANDIIISRTVADRLNLAPGDKINTCFFVDGKIRLRNFRVAALYESNFGDYDRIVAFSPIKALRWLQGLDDNRASRIEISSLALKDLPSKQRALQQLLDNMYYSGVTEQYLVATSILQTGAQYFNWLDLLDTNVVVIIILMSAISTFTLIASLFILILERVNMIGTLKTIGASDRLIRRIFIILASKILLRGLAIGNALALTLILIQRHFHIIPLDPEAYYISYVPMEISAAQIFILNAAAVVAGLLVMIIPSMIITRMSPARTVRFE